MTVPFRTIIFGTTVSFLIMVCPGLCAENSIETEGNVVRFKAGILQRTMECDGHSISNTRLKVDGQEVSAAGSGEFSLTISRAEPNQCPARLKPELVGEIDSCATDGNDTDTLKVKEKGGGHFDPGVKWIEPVTAGTNGPGGLFENLVPKIEKPQQGVTRLTLAGNFRKETTIDDVKIELVYETYDGYPAVRKWISVYNQGRRWLKIDRLVIDDITLAEQFRQKISLTPVERGAASSVMAFGNSDQSRGIIAVSEIPSALRNMGDNGSMGYNQEFFEWVLGPGESFTSEPVFHYAYSGVPERTISALSTPLDRVAEVAFKKFLVDHIGVTGPTSPLCAPQWSSWSNFGPALSDAIVREQADLAARCGFVEMELDDGWQNDRLGTQPDTRKFPDFEATCKYVQSKGLKLGLWVSCFRSEGSKDLKELPEMRSLPYIRRLAGYGMSFASPWRDYYAKDLVGLHRQYGVSYFKQDFTNIRFGDLAAGHESRTLKESFLRGLRGLLAAEDIIRREAPSVATQISHEIYWGTPGVPCDVAALKHVTSFHVPPNDYSGVGNNKQRFNPDSKYDPVQFRQKLIGGCFKARQRFYAHRGLPLYGIEWYGAATFNVHGSLTVEVQDRQVCSWLMGAPLVFAGDLASLTEENIKRYRQRFDLLKRLQDSYDIYHHFQFSGVPEPTDTDWHWWGKLDERGCGAVVVLRGNGGKDQCAINIPWVDSAQTYKVTALLEAKELGVFTGKQLHSGELTLTLPSLGQEILELSMGKREKER